MAIPEVSEEGRAGLVKEREVAPASQQRGPAWARRSSAGDVCRCSGGGGGRAGSGRGAQP